MRMIKLAIGVALGMLALGLASCSDSAAAKSCINTSNSPSTPFREVCLSSDGKIAAAGLMPGSTLTITTAAGVSALKVAADGTLADGMSVVDTSGKPVTISFEGSTADGGTISGELTQPD